MMLNKLFHTEYSSTDDVKSEDRKVLSGAKLVGSDPARGRVSHDYYATPFNATEAILSRISLGFDTILEPAAGEGHIIQVLRKYYPNNKIIANDLICRESRLGIEVNGGVDFLEYDPKEPIDTIITNPPFALAQAFIEKALSIANHYVIIFARIQLLETAERKEMFKYNPPHFVYVFSKRVAPLPNGEAVAPNGKPWSSTMCFAWFVWEKGYTGDTIIRWL